MTSYSLEPLAAEDLRRWDSLIAPFESRDIFHRTPWLNHLEAAHHVAIRRWAISCSGRTVGYFSGGILKQGPFRILGSPLKGWYTNSMGPIANNDGFDLSAFLAAVDTLAAEEQLAMLEIEGSCLQDVDLSPFGYEPTEQSTYLVEITPEDLDPLWRRLHKKARKAVRVAKEKGVTVQDTADPGIVDELYDQLRQELARINIAPAFPKDVPRSAFQHLKPLDLMFALRVVDGDGRSIATGLFPHDDRTIYFSFTGSRMAAWSLFPNDLMHWTAIELAASRGIRTYNMCGFGRFKSKFGGTLAVGKRWHKCYWRSARWAREGYKAFFTARLALRGRWNSLAHRHWAIRDQEAKD